MTNKTNRKNINNLWYHIIWFIIGLIIGLIIVFFVKKAFSHPYLICDPNPDVLEYKIVTNIDPNSSNYDTNMIPFIDPNIRIKAEEDGSLSLDLSNIDLYIIYFMNIYAYDGDMFSCPVKIMLHKTMLYPPNNIRIGHGNENCGEYLLFTRIENE